MRDQQNEAAEQINNQVQGTGNAANMFNNALNNQANVLAQQHAADDKNRKDFGSIIGGAAQGAMSGASVGGGWGALAGGVLGGAAAALPA